MPNNKSYQQLQFSNEDEEKLIDLVKENPPLYGVKNKSYKDIELKENIWKIIAHELNKSVSDCKMKWKHIRDYYQRQRREGKKSTRSAAGSGSGNKFDSLQFLEGSFVERQTKTNVPTKKRKMADIEIEEESQGIDTTLTERLDVLEEIMYQDEQVPLDVQKISELNNNKLKCQQRQQDLESQYEGHSDYTEHIEDDNNARPLPTPQPPRHIQEPMKIVSSRSPPKKSTPRREILKEIQKGRKERLELLHSFNKDKKFQSQSSHPIDLFFQSMAAVVKKFPPRLILDARNKVCNLIGELELQSVIEQETTNAESQLCHTWTVATVPTDITFPQTSSPTYSTHSSNSATTSQSESIPHTLHQQTYDYSVQTLSEIADTNEPAEFTVLNSLLPKFGKNNSN